MANAIDRAIDALSDPTLSTEVALRRLLVVAHRIGASELTSWINLELAGYGPQDKCPDYRDGVGLGISVEFAGPFDSAFTRRLSWTDLPEQLGEAKKGITLTQPLAELEALASDKTEGVPHIPMPLAWVELFRRLAEEKRAPRIEYHVVNKAWVEVQRPYLRGILSRIRSAALNLALEIEEVSPNAGDVDGPTVKTEPELADRVGDGMTMIYAPNSTIAVGSGAHAVNVQLQVGDADGLLREVRSLLGGDSADALADALREDGDTPGPATERFLDRVKAGGISLAGNVAASGAYDVLTNLLAQVFPAFG